MHNLDIIVIQIAQMVKFQIEFTTAVHEYQLFQMKNRIQMCLSQNIEIT